eukprot:s5635_g5.t3
MFNLLIVVWSTPLFNVKNFACVMVLRISVTRTLSFVKGGSCHGLFEQQAVKHGTLNTPAWRRVNKTLPLVVIYVPIIDVIRAGGKVTESGSFLCSNTIHFRFVKEVWLCVPNDRHRSRYDIVEKILDYELEDEICTEYHPSPIAIEFSKYRTVERLMQLLCEMPNGPHDATKEEYVARLGDYCGVDWRSCLWHLTRGHYTVRRFRTHQLITQIMRGAYQMGFARRDFDTSRHMRPEQGDQAPQMHSSCYALLQKIIGKTIGYSQFTLLQSINRFNRQHILCIDPCGIAMMFGAKNCTQIFLAFLVDSDIQLPSNFINRLTASRQQAPTARSPNALNHLPSGLPGGRRSIVDTPVTREEAEAADEARRVRASARRQREETRGATPPPPQQPRNDRWQRNQRAYDNRSDGSCAGYRYSRARYDNREYSYDDDRWNE